MGDYELPNDWDAFSEHTDPAGYAFDMDRALWCHLLWLDEKVADYRRSVPMLDEAGFPTCAQETFIMQQTMERARDNLIASLDRAWGMDT